MSTSQSFNWNYSLFSSNSRACSLNYHNWVRVALLCHTLEVTECDTSLCHGGVAVILYTGSFSDYGCY